MEVIEETSTSNYGFEFLNSSTNNLLTVIVTIFMVVVGISSTSLHRQLHVIYRMIQSLHHVISDRTRSQSLTLENALMYMHGNCNEDAEMDPVIQRIIHVCMKIIICERILVMLMNKNSNKFAVYEHITGKVTDIDSSRGICGWVVSTAEILNITDLKTDQRFSMEKFLLPDTKTLLCAPILTTTNEVIGLICACNRIDDGNIYEFTAAEELDINYIAANASLAIRRAQFYQKALRAKRKSQALLAVVRARTSDQTIENILDITIQAAYDLLLPERVTVYLCDHRKEEAWICVSKDNIEGLTIRFNEGVAGTVAATGKTIRIDNAYDDSRFLRDVDADTGFHTKSMLCCAVPGFGADSKPIAVIQVMNKLDGRVFDDDDEEALMDFCEEVSLAFRRKMLDMSLLKIARNIKFDISPDKQSAACLEESLLKEYASVAQRSHYSTIVRKKSDSFRGQFEFEARKSITSAQNGGPTASSLSEHIIYSVIHRWDVDAFEISESDLMVYVEQMFVYYDLIDTYRIPQHKLRNFIKSVHKGYPTNNFHNFKHGWSVLHMTYQILRHGAAQYLTTLEIFAALIGSFCHDLDHPGHSNAFEIASSGPLSLIYGDDAVLERHHTAETLRLLKEKDNDILEFLSNQEKLEMRRLLNSAIMATDMAQHFAHVESLAAHARNEPTLDPSSPSHRTALLGGIVHCADLSAQTLNSELAKKWGDALIMEFRAQSAKEIELQLPLTPHLQGLESELKCMQLQYGFVSNIVLPLWTALAEIFPEVRHMADQANVNKQYYMERVQNLSFIELSMTTNKTTSSVKND